MENFTPYSALIGGILIGTAATLLLWLGGQVAGISGIFRGVLQMRNENKCWRGWFILGLAVGGGVWWYLGPPNFEPRTDFPLGLTILAGLLVGFGSRVGNGCTSGHGVCGIGRISVRSLVSTMTFFTVAVFTTFVVRHVLGVVS